MHNILSWWFALGVNSPAWVSYGLKRQCIGLWSHYAENMRAKTFVLSCGWPINFVKCLGIIELPNTGLSADLRWAWRHGSRNWLVKGSLRNESELVSPHALAINSGHSQAYFYIAYCRDNLHRAAERATYALRLSKNRKSSCARRQYLAQDIKDTNYVVSAVPSYFTAWLAKRNLGILPRFWRTTTSKISHYKDCPWAPSPSIYQDAETVKNCQYSVADEGHRIY